MFGCTFFLLTIQRASSSAKQSSHVAGYYSGKKGKGRESAANEEPRRTLNRKLTEYVVTRWYRAPELILLQVMVMKSKGSCVS